MTDNFLEVLSGRPPKDKRRKCYYQTWLSQQTPEAKVAIEGAMNNTKWKTTDLFPLFRDRGYDRQYNSLRLHRSGSCACND